MTQAAHTDVDLAAAVESAVRQLVSVSNWGNNSFVSLPVFYPGGGAVSIGSSSRRQFPVETATGKGTRPMPIARWTGSGSSVAIEFAFAYDVPETTGGHGGADDLAVAEFFKFAEEGASTLTSPVAGRYAVAAGIAATESIRQGGGAVVVPALSEELMKLE